MKSLRDTALDYVERLGWSVFPAKFAGKKKFGCTSAENSNGNPWGSTRDPDEIRAYWRRWPNAAIGLPTGAVNGLFVVETDTIDGHGVDGRESLIQLVVQHGDLPWTRMAESPTGSVHRYFKIPQGVAIPCSASKLGSGIDVRGDGGFVIAPPSVRPGRGAYFWINYAAIANAPRWLIDLVAVRPQPHVEADPVLMAMMRADAGAGISFDPDDYFADDADPELKIRAALSVIPSDDYDVWFRIGAAIYDALGDTGYELFDEWSRESTKYEPRACERKWRDVSRMRSSIRVNTIFYYADQHDREWRRLYRQVLSEVAA
jgi:Bifunctional DNA primase/polymerase, N-terminal/Primase C terminal 2 (PriCT-2)